MSNIPTLEGDLIYSTGRFALVVARFNGFIVESLLAGALDTLKRYGVPDDRITVIKVPGAYEMPVVVQRLAQTGSYEAIIGLGAVIRGSTPHFDFVAGEAAKGMSSVALDHGIPVIFGVLTTDTIEQAIERAGTKAGNKGAEAAATAIEMVNVLAKIS
ncbi:MAG: 6,7-dimethyl-8-ribityllumazine synthase [Gammaproteobacteria bacterium]|nr:6,7-dimethyl-8-ribityllumazine synthase [Gammaproteobacteria bacterium]HEX5637610.1 6,7-dimethyl-8-ribityllumazine synthase [Gammaproteobacteria bacterium]